MYITGVKSESFKTKSRNYMDYLYGKTTTEPKEQKFPNTYTLERTREEISSKIYYPEGWFNTIIDNINLFKTMFPDETQWYTSFRIPKHSGGFRTINAPIPQLKELQRRIIFYLTHTRMHTYPIVYSHDCAYAYIKGRSALDALKVHQKNNSRWFLKLDIQDFFPSFNREFILKQINQIYPWSEIGESIWSDILDVCMLNDGLPQGAPTSPMLTNILMVPVDYHLNKALWAYERNVIKYTRYADDLLISSRVDMRKDELISLVKDVLKDTPLKIKTEKTRYGSNAGRNWNLGIMLNQHNQLTLGHKRKKEIKNLVYHFMRSPGTWLHEDIHNLQGQVAYMKHVEPEYTAYILKKIQKSTDSIISFEDMVKLMLYDIAPIDKFYHNAGPRDPIGMVETQDLIERYDESTGAYEVTSQDPWDE